MQTEHLSSSGSSPPLSASDSAGMSMRKRRIIKAKP